MSKKIGVGIIGCGKIAQTRHAPEYAANENVRIVGFCDFVYERAQEMARKYGGRAFASVEEMLSCEEVEAVSVCSANHTHASVTVEALRWGKHVLCEKPMATTMEECEAMQREAKLAKKTLAIAHNQRLHPVHRRAKELLAQGAIGAPISFKTCFGHSGPDHWSVDPGTGNWFFDRSQSAFGAIADLGIHKIDLISYLLERNAVQVQAMMGTLHKRNGKGEPVSVDDNALLTLFMEGGVMGTVEVSWTYYGGEENHTVIYGEKGRMLLSPERGAIKLSLQNGDEAEIRVAPAESTGVIDAFISSLQREEEGVLDVERVMPSMKAMFAAVESAATGERICL